MKRIRVLFEDDDAYLFDTQRIRTILAQREFDCTLDQARKLWERFSESMACGWHCLPDSDDTVFDCICPYFIENED